MRVIPEGEARIRLEATGEGFEITAEGVAISPYHLLAASLASCNHAHGGILGRRDSRDTERRQRGDESCGTRCL